MELHPGGNPMNPYGAVPEALKETRLSLRDIMGDFLQNKVLEGRINLEKSKAETETALVGAGIERERLTNLRDLSRMRMTQEMHDEDALRQEGQFGRNLALQTKGQEDTSRIAGAQLKVSQGHLDVSRTAEQRAGREEARKNEVRSAGDWVEAAGMSKGLLDFLGVDPNTKMKRADAENVYTTLQSTMKSNPSLAFMAHGYSLKADLQGLQAQLAAPGITPEQAAPLRAQYDKKMRLFQNLDQLIMAEKTPDQAKIVAEARKSYTENPQLAEKYPTFEKFLDTFTANVTKARSVFQDDIKKLRTGEGAATPEEQGAAAEGIKTMLMDVKAGKYKLSDSQKNIVARMTSNVSADKYSSVYSSLKKILGVTDAGDEIQSGKYGARVDGTPKGSGYFGELKMTDGSGRVATELSIGVNLDGKETLIPALVPTLTEKEKDHLLSGGKLTQAIVDKAVAHAKGRFSEKKSPFADEETTPAETTPARKGIISSVTKPIVDQFTTNLSDIAGDLNSFMNRTTAPLRRRQVQ
jgi:hypothetical protein